MPEDEVIVYKPDVGRKAKKRKVGYLVVVLLLLVSAALLALFFLSTEPKGTEHIIPERPRGLPVEMLSLDLHPHDRYMISLELDELLAATELRPRAFSRTRDDEMPTWRFDRTTPLAMMTSDFFVYADIRSPRATGMLHAGYKSGEPISPTIMTIDIDGYKYTANVAKSDVVDLGHVGEVYEFVDIPIDDVADALKHLPHAERTTVIFASGAGRRQFTLTKSQEASVGRMMRMISLRRILEKDSAEREARAAAEAEAKK